MERSVDSYLEKCTTEELSGILSYCLRENNYSSYEYMILKILKILEQRLPLEELSPSVMQYLTMYLRSEKKDKDHQ